MDKNQKQPAQNWLPIATAALSLISALGVAIIGFMGNVRLETLRSETQKVSVRIQEEQVALEQRRLEIEQQARKENIIATYVPKLVSGDEAERRAATAVLFVLYPNEAKDILARVAASVGNEARPAFEASVAQAQVLANRTGPWTVITASAATLESAQVEVERAKAQGYSPAMIYQQEEWFTVAVGSFPTQDEAQQALVAIRAKIRDNAFVVDLGAWCNAPVGRGAYYECQPR